MNRKEFEENLLLYGANIGAWPEQLRQSGLEAVERSPELQELQKDHDNFETILQARRHEEPADNFAQRIISASFQRRQRNSFSLGSFVAGLIDEFHMPRPALAVISLAMLLALTIGFTLGFRGFDVSPGSKTTEETDLQAFLFDEGDVI